MRTGQRGARLPGKAAAASLLAAVCLTGVFAQPAAAGHPIMQLPPEQLAQIMAEHHQAGRTRAMAGAGAPLSFPRSLSLLPLLPYVPSERDQGQCGDCWAWSGTGAMEIAHNVQSGVAARLSVQFLNSCNSRVSCCAGGWLSDLANFYTTEGFAVPWSNTNGAWTSGNGGCGTVCGSIATGSQFPITSVSTASVATWGVSQAQAIANIKAALNQNEAVWFGFFMGSQADWNRFDSFWDYQPESAPWTNFNPGEAMTTGGGHAILCVGYNDDDPAGPSWTMVNSWGTTSGRPHGTLNVSQNINYGGTYTSRSVPYQQLYFETLNVQFAQQTSETLTINVNGTGAVLTGGTNAPSTITAPYGQAVNLTAQGNFLAWSGSQSSTGTNVQIVLTTNLSITANFQDGQTPLAPFIVTQPVSQNLPIGGNLALSVAGFGIPAPTFSWSMGGQAVGNGTSNLTITNVTPSNQGSYGCIVSNTAGSVQSASVLVNVEAAPDFAQQPVSQLVAVGGTARFSAVANSSNVTYQWFKSSTALPGCTKTSLVISNVQNANSGSYSVVISNAAIAASATSAVVTLTAVSRPVISVQPAGLSLVLGSNAALSVTAGGGSLSYLWKMGASVQSSTGSTCPVNSSIAGTAAYTVVVGNLAGSVTSSSASVSVIAPPAIPAAPANKYLSAGGSGTIAVVCTNMAGTYSWFYNGTNALNSTTNRYTITGATTNNSGTYSLVLSNIAGVVTNNVIVSVFLYPSILGQPAAANMLPAGTNVDLVVGAYGSSLQYQWSKNARAIKGATNATLSLANLVVSNSGSYTVAVTNNVGGVASHTSVLTVIPPPAITTRPRTQTLVVNQPLNLSVAATGAKPCTQLSYQWQFGTNIANATNSTYSIPNISSNWAGTFTVMVGNFGGSTNVSANITVTADMNAPKLAVVVPTKAVTNSPYTLTGTAKDNVAVTNVAFSLNGGAGYTNAVTSNSWTNWSAVMPFVPGTNTVMVVATDINGLTTINTSKIKYAPFFAAVLTTDGNGTGVVAGFTNRMQYGVSYSLMAKPAARNLFQSWSGLSGIPAASSTNAAKFTFTVTNTVGVTVSFATNLFFDRAGAFNGLFYQTNNPTHDSSGFLNVTITTNLGYSGKVLFDGQIIKISGQLDTNGTAGVALNPNVTLAFAVTNQQLIGTVSSTNWTSALTADMATFNKTNPNLNFNGAFDIVIPPAATGPASNGYGFGAVTVNTNGVVTFAGSTADGSALSQSAPISRDGYWPLFVQIYPVNKTNTAGEIFGWINFAGNGAPSGTVSWIKTGYTNSGSYAAGLTNTVAILGSPYTAPGNSSPGVLNGMTSGRVTFAGGNLTNSFADAMLMTNGSVYCYDSTMSMKFTSGGLFTGKFLDNGTGKPASFFGAVLQNSTNACGYFPGANQSGSVTLVPTP